MPVRMCAPRPKIGARHLERARGKKHGFTHPCHHTAPRVDSPGEHTLWHAR